MVFARVAYDEEPHWAVAEGKYLRLIDGAPYEAWEYLGTEVRGARAKLFAPLTGQLICLRLDTGAQTRKNAARVPEPNAELPCPKEGMDCLCGLAAMVGEQGICGFAAFGGGAVGPYFSETLPEDVELSVRVNGEARVCAEVRQMHEALRSKLAAESYAPGDVIAAVSAAGRLQPGDLLEVSLPGSGSLKSALRRR